MKALRGWRHIPPQQYLTLVPFLNQKSSSLLARCTQGVRDAGMFAWATANTCPEPVHPKMHMLLSLRLSGRDLVIVSL